MIFKVRHPTLSKYILGNISLAFIAILFVLSFIVIGNQIVRFLIKGQALGIENLGSFIIFGTVKFLPVLLSLSLFLAILVTLSRFHQNTEMTAMQSLGVKKRYFWRYILPIVVVIVTLVLWMQFFLNPYALFKVQNMQKSVDKVRAVTKISPKKFHYFGNGKIVLYADFVDKQQKMSDLFIQSQQNSQNLIIVAQSGYIDYDQHNFTLKLYLANGKVYQDITSTARPNIISFGQYQLLLEHKPVITTKKEIKTDIKTQTIIELWQQWDAQKNAEFSYRLSMGFAIFLLSILAILLARLNPQKISTTVIVVWGAVIFVLYYNLLSVARKLMLENGWHLFWVHLIFIALIIWLYFKQKP